MENHNRRSTDADDFVRQLEAERVITTISSDLKYIQEDLKDIKESLRRDYVPKADFDLVKKIVYGLVGLILLAVGGAIVGNVLI